MDHGAIQWRGHRLVPTGRVMTVGSLDVVFYTLAFVVPGFVMHSAIAMFLHRRAESDQLTLLRFLVYSSVNYALSSGVVYHLLVTDFPERHPWWTAVLWPLFLLGLPFAIGAILGHMAQRDAVREALSRLGVRLVHPAPTAWDRFFGALGSSRWVIVRLRDGNEVCGLFGENSYAATAASGGDVFLEEVRNLADDGTWLHVPASAGIWLPGSEIKHIEFWKEGTIANEDAT